MSNVNRINAPIGPSLDDIALDRNRQRMIRKELRKEIIAESNREHEDSVHELQKETTIFEDEIVEAQELNQNAWDNEKIYSQSAIKYANIKNFNKNLNLELVKNFNFKYLNMEELEYLFDAYMDQVHVENIDNLVDSIENIPEGLELEELNSFIGGKLSIGQTYILLCYIMEQLRKRAIQKHKFLAKLRQWIAKYERQESDYLLEFFSLGNIKKDNSSVTNSNIDSLVKLSTAKASITGVKDAIDFIRDSFNNNYDNVVSIYIKLRANQLKLLAKTRLNSEAKTQITELISIEKHLIVANTLYRSQISWYDNLAKKSIINNDLFTTVNITDLLHGVTEFMSSSFISKMAIEKLFRICRFNLYDNKIYVKLLSELGNNINSLPQVLYEYKPEKLKTILEKIQGISIELTDDKNLCSKPSQEPDFLNKPVSALKRYV